MTTCSETGPSIMSVTEKRFGNLSSYRQSSFASMPTSFLDG